MQAEIRVLGDNYENEKPTMHFMSICHGIYIEGMPDDFVHVFETGDNYNGGKIECCVCDNECMGIGYMIVKCDGVYFKVSFVGVLCRPIWEPLPFK